MDRNRLKEAIRNGMVEWQTHALERMMKRGISSEIIEDYPDDKPFPTALFLVFRVKSPLTLIVIPGLTYSLPRT